MPGSLLTLPARLTIRVSRAVLTTTRDVSQQALGVVDLVAQLVETPTAADVPSPAQRRFEESFDEPTDDLADRWVDEVAASPAFEVPAEDALDAFPEAADISADPEFGRPEHITAEVELVEEFAEPGAQDGAGAQLRVEAPWPAYDDMTAADIVSRLPVADAAELAAIELYESTHRQRRTVLDGIARQTRRRPPQA